MNYLEGFITPRRIARMKKVLEQRTRYIACVLEDLYDPRNGSAVIRHCDALGIQEVHAIGGRNKFRTEQQVDMGTAQWLDVKIYNQKEEDSQKHSCTKEVLRTLKSRNYRIVSTSLYDENAESPESLNLTDGPVALVFGSEKNGISDDVRAMTDTYLRIPMVGFVESFNISASAAIVFYILTHRLHHENLPWKLDDADAREIYSRWVKISAPYAEELISNRPEPAVAIKQYL